MSRADDKAKTRNNSINMSVDDLNNPISDYFFLSFFFPFEKGLERKTGCENGRVGMVCL